MLSQDKCLDIISKILPTTQINDFQTATLQKMAIDLGMTNLSHREEIINSFPRYFYRYLQKNKITNFIQNDEEDIDIQINISEVEEVDEPHKKAKEAKEFKKKDTVLMSQSHQQSPQITSKLQQSSTHQPFPLQYQQQIFQFQNPQFLFVNPGPESNIPIQPSPVVPPKVSNSPAYQLDQPISNPSNSNQQLSPQPQQFCLQMPPSTTLPPSSSIHMCSKCNQQKPLPFQKFGLSAGYCQTCILQIMNPLSETVEYLKEQYFITKDGKLELECLDLDFKVPMQLHQSTLIEVRCVLPSVLQEITFPHNCLIKLNDKEIKHCKPLQIKSCLHKRKDNSIFYKAKDVNNRITIQQMRMEAQYRYDEPGLRTKYLVGIFLVKELKPEQLIAKLLEQQKHLGIDYFSDKIRMYQK